MLSNACLQQSKLQLLISWMIMGNCLKKKTQDPNEPRPEPALPPTGVDAFRNTRSKKISGSSAHQQISSGRPSKHSQAKPCKDKQCEASRQERHRHVSSNSRKERRGKIKRPRSPKIPRDWPASRVRKVRWVPARNIKCFYYSVLRAATQKFSDENLIGEGGFGGVYIGYINPHTMKAAKPDTGRAVAIKTLRRRGVQSAEEWQTELRILSTLNHPNVVKLNGYCYEREHRILVYEYLCKGSLDAHLFSENDTQLNWSRRIKIATGVARAVEYLHRQARPIIHRDLKASNVLLDADFNPKLSDFGLARHGPLDDQSHVSTRVLGTKGYLAPEYFTTGHLTVKTDVYSFGVVLLEILSGCVGTTRDLAVWAKPYLSNQTELHNIIDKKIARNMEMEEAHRFASIIPPCLSTEPKERPTMAEILANLEQLQHDTLLRNFNTLGLSKYHRGSHLF